MVRRSGPFLLREAGTLPAPPAGLRLRPSPSQVSELAPGRGVSSRVHLLQLGQLPLPSPSHPSPPSRRGSLPIRRAPRSSNAPAPRRAGSLEPAESCRPSRPAFCLAARRGFPPASPFRAPASPSVVALVGLERCLPNGDSQTRPPS